MYIIVYVWTSLTNEELWLQLQELDWSPSVNSLASGLSFLVSHVKNQPVPSNAVVPGL